jgi:uncharacterized protein
LNLPTDPVFYGVATLAVVLVGLAKGGFSGLGATTMPLLALVMDPIKGAAMLLPILIVQDVVGVWAYRKTWDRRTVAIMVAGAAVGITLGWWFAATVSVKFVQGMIGLIAIAFGVNRLLANYGTGITLRRAFPDWVGSFWGMVSGFTSQIGHAGGPPFQVWAMTRNFPRDVFVGTSCVFFAIINWLKVPAYLALGQFTMENFALTAVFLPVAILSTMGGVWLVRRIDPARFFTIIYALMILIGIELLRVALS